MIFLNKLFTISPMMGPDIIVWHFQVSVATFQPVICRLRSHIAFLMPREMPPRRKASHDMMSRFLTMVEEKGGSIYDEVLTPHFRSTRR